MVYELIGATNIPGYFIFNTAREFTAHAEFRGYWEAVLIGCGYSVAWHVAVLHVPLTSTLWYQRCPDEKMEGCSPFTPIVHLDTPCPLVNC